jgi:hypothetical protein
VPSRGRRSQRALRPEDQRLPTPAESLRGIVNWTPVAG